MFGERSDDPARRVPTVSFVVAGRNSRDVVQAIERVSDFGIRWGAFYANRLVEDFLGLGVEGVVRVSMVHYNTGKWKSISSELHVTAQKVSGRIN